VYAKKFDHNIGFQEKKQFLAKTPIFTPKLAKIAEKW
jgi:hypothetical protein